MADNKATVGGKYLEYKGKPLVREGDTICYGDMDDKCILILEQKQKSRQRSSINTKVSAFTFGVNNVVH